MISGGVTPSYAETILEQNLSSDLFSLLRVVQLYLLDSDYTRLRQTINSDSASTILTGLISSQNLVTKNIEDMQCNPIGSLEDWNTELLTLGICCGRAILSSNAPTNRDNETFSRNQVECIIDDKNIVDWIILRHRKNRLLDQWTLVDGERTQPGSILRADFSTARKVTIYDRFFDHKSLDVIIESIAAAASLIGSPLNLNINIILGSRNNKPRERPIVASYIRHLLGNNLTAASSISIEKVAKAPAGERQLHDRFIQIDNSYSYIFSAGISCFYEFAGRTNRNSTIYRFSIDPVYEEFNFYTIGNNKQTNQHLIKI